MTEIELADLLTLFVYFGCFAGWALGFAQGMRR